MVSFNFIRGYQYFVHDRKSRKMFHESINKEHSKKHIIFVCGKPFVFVRRGGSQGVVSSRGHVSHGSVVTTCGGLWVWEYSLWMVNGVNCHNSLEL